MKDQPGWKAAGAVSDGKADTGKLRYDLLMLQFGGLLKEVVGVLTFGAEKYPKPPLDDSWIDVPEGVRRYSAAVYRHLDQFLREGETNDPESNLHHLAHVVCNLCFIYELSKTNQE